MFNMSVIVLNWGQNFDWEGESQYGGDIFEIYNYDRMGIEVKIGLVDGS